jgi:putative hydrolase of the HAD superfamily
MKIKGIIFDFWDTLCPATIDFVHLKALISENGVEMNDFIRRYELAVQRKKYSKFNELRNDFFNEFKSFDNELLEKELYEIYHNRFDKIYFFPKTEQTLIKLKKEGYKIGLLSNMENLPIKEIEKKLNLKKYFDYLGYSFDMNAVKPNPKTFFKVLSELDLGVKDTLMVGDSLHSDIIGAKSIGMANCWIERKKIRGKLPVKPDYKIKSIEEIFKVLGNLNSKEDL